MSLSLPSIFACNQPASAVIGLIAAILRQLTIDCCRYSAAIDLRAAGITFPSFAAILCQLTDDCRQPSLTTTSSLCNVHGCHAVVGLLMALRWPPLPSAVWRKLTINWPSMFTCHRSLLIIEGCHAIIELLTLHCRCRLVPVHQRSINGLFKI